MYPQCVALHIRVTKLCAAGVSPSRSLSKNGSVGFSAVVFRLPRAMFQYLTFVDLVPFQGSGYGTWSYITTPFPIGKLYKQAVLEESCWNGLSLKWGKDRAGPVDLSTGGS